jgi:SSS family solute:Na+ symporter
MVNVAVGIVWQTALTATGIFIVLQDTHRLMYSVALIVISSIVLKFNWYDKLEDYPADLREGEGAALSPTPKVPVAAAVAAT